MKGKPLGVAVIGMGMMGRGFAQICNQLWEAELIGVSDISDTAGNAAAQEFGVPHYKEYSELIRRPDVHTVIIATPEDAHVEPTVAALEAGKSVLLEKPIADNLADAQRIAETAARTGGLLMVGHILRFVTHYALAKSAVDSGQIGPVQYMQTRRLNGKNAQDRLKGRCSLPAFLGVHDYDIVRWFAGSEPERVYAESQAGVLQKMGYNTEDTNWAMITFKNGVLAVCECGWILPAGHINKSDTRFYVQGADGRLDVELLNQGILQATEQASTFPGTVFMPRVYGEIRMGFVNEVQHFLACARQEKQPLISVEDAVAAVRIADAVVESARTHQPVLLS